MSTAPGVCLAVATGATISAVAGINLSSPEKMGRYLGWIVATVVGLILAAMVGVATGGITRKYFGDRSESYKTGENPDLGQRRNTVDMVVNPLANRDNIDSALAIEMTLSDCM